MADLVNIIEKPIILVVDDDPDIIEFINKILRMYDENEFKVIYATTGEGAISMINTVKINALVLDVKLPDVTGITVGLKVRKHMPDLPIAFFTSYKGSDIEAKAKEINAFYWYKLEVMANPRQLLDCLKSLLNNKSCTTDSLIELRELMDVQKKRVRSLILPPYLKSQICKFN